MPSNRHQPFKRCLLPALLLATAACQSPTTPQAGDEAVIVDSTVERASVYDTLRTLRPVVVTDSTRHDTDDPAIWHHPTDPAQSLILGTDKNRDGALYVYDLDGKIIEEKVVRGLQRPNNVDVAYGLLLNGEPTDVAVVTERFTHALRVFSLPDLKPVDGGGLEVFVGETGEEHRALMGIALYEVPNSDTVYAVVGRKQGPREGYLWQYLLRDDGTGQVAATLVRKFGRFSGHKE
ncbi:MAG: phytase, partial [Catalinimonas sp.]